ncbi:MAG: nucleotide exchange factor GrpE [Patescibacteria group bacterium]
MNTEDDVVIEPDDESLEGEGASATKLSAQIKKIKSELEKALKERQEYLDGWQRAKADYVNIRKRAEDERQALVKGASRGLVEALLPALDSFDHAMSSVEGGGAWIEGIKNTHSQLMKALEAEDVSAFDPLGEIFDPNVHEPVETVAVTSEVEDNTVTKVYQKGYTLHGTIIRPARVAVGHYQNS